MFMTIIFQSDMVITDTVVGYMSSNSFILKKKKKKTFVSITCHISLAYRLKYMIQLVIDGKNQKTKYVCI